MPRRLFLSVVVAALLALSAAGTQEPSPELRAKVKELVGQLETANPQAQAAAEWDLLRLGPAVLPLLPTPEPKAKRLQETVVDTLKELQPRTFTLRARVTLKEALKELARQTGVVVADRSDRKPEATFALECKALPFWKALDLIAKRSKTRVSLYGPDGRPALEKGWPSWISYHGVFRTTLKHLTVSADLETGAHTCTVLLDLAWEPRLPVFLVETGSATVIFDPATLDLGLGAKKVEVLKAKLPGRGRDQLKPPGHVHELSLRMPAPDRSARNIDTLRGTLVVTAATKMLTFTFDKLREIGPKGKAEAQTPEGVRVRLVEVARETDPDRFSFQVVIENPRPGPRFDSHESWLEGNAIWLENRKTKQRLDPVPLPEVDERTAARAVVRYDFTPKNRKGRLGPLTDWVLHYHTPGRMVELSVPYEFKGVALP